MFKSRYKKLKDSYASLYDEYKKLKDKYEELENEYSLLQASKKNDELRDVLKDFDFAILIQDRCMPTIWNDGRFEEHVRSASVTVRNDDYRLPQIRIEK